MGQLRTLVPYLLRYRWRLAAGLLSLAGKDLAAAAVPFIVGTAIDRLVAGFNASELWRMAGLLAALGLIRGFFQYWMRWILIGISRDIEYDLRNDLFTHLTKLPPRFYELFRTGDLLSRSSNDLNAVRMLLGPGIMYAADFLLVFIAVLTVMSATDWRLTLLVFVPIPLVSVSVSYFGQRIHTRFQSVQARFSDICSMVQENLSNVRVLRAFVRQRPAIKRFRSANNDYVKENLELIRLWGTFYPLLEILIGLTYVAVLWYGGRRVLSGTIEIGDFVMFLLYLAMLTWPMVGAGWVVNLVQRGTASLARLNEIFEQATVFPGPANGSDTAIRGDLEFRDVYFTYPGSSRPALDGVSLYVPAGQTVVILGETGSGKSTLVSLIPRLLDPSAGRVLVDGIDVQDLPIEQLRRAVGFVPQESFLFNRPVRDNLALRSPEAEDWEVFEAAEAADLARDIAEFPKRYETEVGERGVTLSGGQKQRASLARALLGQPRILILDDAASNVDMLTEERILENLRVAMRNRTTVIISHRVSIAQRADWIFVLAGGKVAEGGTHEELLARNGSYADLYRKQLIEEELENA